MSVAVIYLERFGNNPHFAQQFRKSMRDNDAGAEFNFVQILKGFDRCPDDYNYDYGVLEAGRRLYLIPDEKYTLSSIRPIIAQLPHDKFLFFHSFSKILAPNWLSHYLDVFKIPGCGIVGATGSLENNPHIRTNAFMMDRKLFLDLMPDDMTTRAEEAVFESGHNNLTDRVISIGRVPVVIDRSGKPYFDFATAANIFRRGHQEDLLIADNRSHHYDVAGYDERIYLHRLAWGIATDYPDVPDTTARQRIEAYTNWNFTP